MYERKTSTDKILKLCDLLPELCVNFLLESGTEMTSSTRLAYAHELHYFFIFLEDKNPYFNGKNIAYLTKTDISVISSSDVSRYLTMEQARNLSERTLARKRAALSRFFSYLTSNRYLDFNPVQAAAKVKIHTSDSVIHLDINEQVQFLNSIYSGFGLTGKAITHHEKYKLRDVTLITFLLDTGMRVSELNACDIKDIDFENCSVFIIRKGNNKQHLYFSDETRDLLRSYCSSRKNNPTYSIDSPLFVTVKEERLSIRAIQSLVKKYANASLPGQGNITPHKMRSSFAMAYYEETKDILALQKELGHKNLSATNIYAKATDKKLQDNRSILSNKRGPLNFNN